MTITMCIRILPSRDFEGYVFRVWNLGRTSLDLYVLLGLALGLDLVSGECFCVSVQVFPYLPISFANRLFGTWRISGPSFVFSSLPPFLIGLSTLFGTPWAKGGVLTKGFGLQAIGTKICMRLSGFGTEPISPPAPGLVRRLFLRHPRAWCGSYFPASLWSH
jgi:hypothetical protein